MKKIIEYLKKEVNKHIEVKVCIMAIKTGQDEEECVIKLLRYLLASNNLYSNSLEFSKRKD